MGSLLDVVVKTEDINTAGGVFTVGPLTASDILSIYIANRAGMQTIFDQYKDGLQQDAIFVDLIVTFPEIAAEVIARANGDFSPDKLAVAARLDIGAQLLALEKIGLLTVSSVGGLGNLAILVERLAGTMTQNVAQASGSLSKDGSTTFESKSPDSSLQDTETHGTIPSG